MALNDYKAHRSFFFNVPVERTSEVIGQVHSGHPFGVPFVQTGLQPRQAQPHERGFINSNANINKSFSEGLDQEKFILTGDFSSPQAHNDIRRPTGASPYGASSPGFRSNIRGGGRGIF